MRCTVAAVLILSSIGSAEAAGSLWPPALDIGPHTKLAATGNVMYDVQRLDGDLRREDAEGFRKIEFGFVAKRADYFEVGAQYEIESRTWLDIYARMHTKGLLGRDVGSLRAGWIKTPVGLDGLTASRAPAFLEPSLPSQAIYAGRRTGVEYAIARPHHQLAVAYFSGNDPEGNEQGLMWGGRGTWTPVAGKGDVWHLGLSHSRERPAGDRARLRARPEAGLTDIRLVDTGSVTNVDAISRSGLEIIRVAGPLTMQAEYLVATVDRRGSVPDVDARGGSVWVGWVLTGESRPYKGTLGNVVPSGPRGAVEVLARYSTLDLDSAVAGGQQQSLTFGLNYYWTQHVKLQANYLVTQADRKGKHTEADGLLLRAQMYF